MRRKDRPIKSPGRCRGFERIDCVRNSYFVLIIFSICARTSGLSLWPCTATACCTAASISSFLVSADIATVQFILLGISRQSIDIRVIFFSFDITRSSMYRLACVAAQPAAWIITALKPVGHRRAYSGKSGRSPRWSLMALSDHSGIAAKWTLLG